MAAARAGRERNERLVTSYTANVSQRFSRDPGRPARPDAYRQEMTAKIEWYRDKQSRVEVTGRARVCRSCPEGSGAPEDLRGNVRDLVINPAEDYLRVVGVDNEDNDNDGFVYPLREGGERDCRFAAYDSTVISLPTGKRIRLLNSRSSPAGVTGSHVRPASATPTPMAWSERSPSGPTVRIAARPRSRGQGGRAELGGNAKGEVFVTLEYGLYENRW
ncbi:MAG: hypothetical protein R2882_11480 [Gemmatimonadales bacterium]